MIKNVELKNTFIQNISIAILSLIFLCAYISTAKSEEIIVNVDQAKLLRLSTPGTDVIIGNPSIADVAIQNSKLLVITGKSFGSTNVIVLNSDRKIITDTVISVTNDSKRVVSLYKGSARESYNCSNKCESILVIGDQNEYFQKTQKAANGKSSLATNTAEPQGGGQ